MIKIRKMGMSDVQFVYMQEIKIFGKSLGKKTLYNEVLYNDLAYYLIALDGNKRVGYIGSWLTIPNAEILNLFTIESYRSKGIATKLLNSVIDYCTCNAIQNLTLEVRDSNKAAQEFYKSLGFKQVAKRKKYYSNNEDAQLMLLELE
ncbi:MAG: ribosomal protein S18-alanine N-acetyltransferase [Candidatus Izimaplasma sp.]|nr:ribosomal protein S18-alanine N-acetyltransferase [Candidatus Izimaplasma bacterium]